MDEQGNKTGEKRTRKDAHRLGLWHRTVHCWIINKEGQLLIQKRAPNKDSHPDKWDISSAGHITAGKDSIITAIEEAQEELGVKLDTSDFELLFTYKNQSVQNNGTFINNEFSDVYLARIDLDLDKLKLQEEEVSKVKLINLEELEKTIREKHPDFVPHDQEYRRLFNILKRKA